MKFMIIIFAIFVTVSARRCVEYGWDYPGSDIEFMNNVQHWSDCANLCADHGSCSNWSWVLLDNSSKYRCYLKTSESGRHYTGAHISGKYDCTYET